MSEAWKRDVVYQVYPRSFADSNGDGVGDLQGITGRLDYLAALGVGVVWLSPIYASPQDDNGYDVSDYLAIDPLFGTLADFDELVAGLHQRGMKLMMDLVVNHTSDEHPWFVESRSSRDNPKRDWYWWRPAGPDRGPPTNWESAFSGSTWELDPATDEWYLHLFAVKQPDLNWENPSVRAAVHSVMRWWLDRGVDGFRMDVINSVSKDVTLPDGPAGAGRYADGSAAYRNGPRMHEFLAEIHRKVFASRPGHVLTVGETPGVTVEQARRYTDPDRHELDMVFHFDHVWLDHDGDKWHQRPFDLLELKATLGHWQTGLAEVGWNSLYWNNHDQPRIVSRWGDDGRYRVESATMLATVLHLHRGTPYIYQGEELGMTNAAFGSIDDFRDIEVRNHFADAVANGEDPASVLAGIGPLNRDNARTPMQWDITPHGGFTSGEPWLAVHSNHVEINAADALADPRSIFFHYQRLIALRKAHPIVVDGRFTMLLAEDSVVYAFTRELDGEKWLVLGNFSSAPAEAHVDDAWVGAPIVIGNYDDVSSESMPIRLRPWETLVLRRH